jgi:glucose/arabinose dehydrogenase
MSFLRKARVTTAVSAAVCVAATVGSGVAMADATPPSPKATNGAKVQVLARDVGTPVAFAFDGSTVFVAGGGNGTKSGGVYVLKGGKAIRLPGSPATSFGVVWHKGTLYVSGGPEILAWSGWNGTKFAKKRVVVKGPKGFLAFNGIAYGPHGRLYSGETLSSAPAADYTHPSFPYANDFLSVSAGGGPIKVVATGLRQPWQPAFLANGKLILSDLGQDNLGKKEPPDLLVQVEQGDNFGFAKCSWAPKSPCSSYTKPLEEFPAHSSAMGIGVSGSTLYVALFGGTGHGSEVVKLSANGGPYTPFLTGFAAPVIAAGVNGNYVYAGDASGAIYRVSK